MQIPGRSLDSHFRFAWTVVRYKQQLNCQYLNGICIVHNPYKHVNSKEDFEMPRSPGNIIPANRKLHGNNCGTNNNQYLATSGIAVGYVAALSTGQLMIGCHTLLTVSRSSAGADPAFG